MFLVAKDPVWQQSLLSALLEALTTRPAAVLLLTPKVHLFSAVTSAPNPFSLLTDFTENTFDGYAAQSLSMPAAPTRLTTNTGMQKQGDVDFIAGGAIIAPGESAIGYWIDDGAANMYMAELFVTPVSFVNPGDTLSLDSIFCALFRCPTGN